MSASDPPGSSPAPAAAAEPPVHPAADQFHLHQSLVDHLDLDGGDVVLDLGCGHGITLAVMAERSTGALLAGLDVDAGSLRRAGSWLTSLGARHQLGLADLSAPLPIATASVTKVICHDLLECLPRPVALMEETSRVLRPGGISVWSHVDYDSTVIAGGDRDLTRRIVHAYADYAQPWMTNCDGQMGRKLAGVVARSPLRRTAVDAAVLTSAELAGPARMRVDDIAATLLRGSKEGTATIEPGDIEKWSQSLEAAAASGDFFYAQTAYVVVATSTGPRQ